MSDITIINGNGHLHGSQKPTRKEVEVFVTEFVNTQVLPKVDEMMQYYLRQVPNLVGQMLEMHEQRMHSAPKIMDDRVLSLVDDSCAVVNEIAANIRHPDQDTPPSPDDGVEL